ncbi:MAG TPA: succinyl-diaminopimelate desuccinylase, partial [Buchnera sp. (in: enterobacteria)]|nr:succinyl-diaminopimelate desuccinylase [Buchnera sp. (in: enterobacteria)]
MFCPVLKLAKQLISIPSISPMDLGCQKIIIERLCAIGFKVELINIKDTCNFWATKGYGKTLTFLGHTDVVNPGKLCNWHIPPFQPVVKNGLLFGRGAADMKGALAAMVVAVERFVKKYPNHTGRLSFLVTSDEESSAINGTKKVVEKLKSIQECIDYCLIGEPSSSEILGDVVKNGRRGSITASITVYGIQGHVAYPIFGDNPIHKVLPFLTSLITENWSQGNNFFPPTQVQIINIQSGDGSHNIIPGELFVEFNFRFGNDISILDIQKKVEKFLLDYCLNYSIKWNISAKPFFTKSG